MVTPGANVVVVVLVGAAVVVVVLVGARVVVVLVGARVVVVVLVGARVVVVLVGAAVVVVVLVGARVVVVVVVLTNIFQVSPVDDSNERLYLLIGLTRSNTTQVPVVGTTITAAFNNVGAV